MLFPSEEFLLIFLPVVLTGYYGIRLLTHNITARNIWLLASSLVFYAWGEHMYVLLMAAVIIFNHLMALLIESMGPKKGASSEAAGGDRGRRIVFILTVAVNILVLGCYKYAGFIFRGTPLSSVTNRIILPIGISFYTFQAISYVADVYTGRMSAERNPLYTGLYISFFPQLIAGPIVRFGTVSESIRHRRESLSGFAGGCERFIRGLIKKVLIANRMAVIADHVWELIIDGRLQASVSLAWLGAISYTLQIFFDFSGYSDMAIGLGGMFGFKLPENFDHPYIADSITGFWRRWHMTLSGWFRDYVYIPLGGSRVSRGRLIFNLLIVWLLTGIWHGADYTFILWGMIYFVALTAEKLAGVRPKLTATAGGAAGVGIRPVRVLTAIVKHIYTLLVVILAWVVFRSDSIGDAIIYLKGMLPFSRDMSCTAMQGQAAWAYLKQNAVFYIAAVILCFPIRGKLEDKLPKGSVADTLYGICKGLCMAAGLILAVSYIYNNAYSPFIYFAF